jgi:hypothetical protein
MASEAVSVGTTFRVHPQKNYRVGVGVAGGEGVVVGWCLVDLGFWLVWGLGMAWIVASAL